MSKAQEKLAKMVCSKCGEQIGGLGSLQAKIVNKELVHIKCPKPPDRPELREKIVMAIDLLFKKENCGYSQYEMDVCVHQLIALLEPKGKPPLLSDEEIVRARCVGHQDYLEAIKKDPQIKI